MTMPTIFRKHPRERGAQLLEFALILPLLLVLVAGVMDFAQSWNLRQMLANAAREGARLGSSQPLLDLTTTNPESIQDICQQVADYLSNAGISTAFMNGRSTDPTAGCSSPATIANPNGALAPLAWTYYSTGTYGLKIERTIAVSMTVSGVTTNVISTRVTLKYPYTWSFGFNRIIAMFGPGAASAYPSPIPIRVNSLMANSLT
ncbi:MAG TPA: TadE/TadG family type IV pilus assembly protein [Candidatus Acidoferrales bacterium]|nr:TadE/TadG family type IV pilus assembly protein [Candidatus Acidoferrales bacterium]